MTPTKRALTTLSVFALLAAPAFAQPSSDMARHHSTTPSETPMSSPQMMMRMQANQSAMMSAMKAMQAQLTLVENTNDPAQRRAAIEKVRGMLSAMQGRMAQCQQMMRMMGGTANGQGMGGMMGGQGMMESPAPSGR